MVSPDSLEAIKPVTPKGGDLAMTTAEKLRQEGKREKTGRKLQYIIFCNTDHEKERDYR